MLLLDCLRLDKVGANRVANQLAEGMHIEFQHDFGAMTFHRSGAYNQTLRYFLVELARGEQRNNFPLA
jgi:hypothetical protein